MDELQQADALDGFLDHLKRGGTSGDEIPSDLARIARRYRALGQSPAPVGARERVQRRVTSSVDRKARGGERPEQLRRIRDVDQPSLRPNGRMYELTAHETSGIFPMQRMRWAGIQLATALLLVVTLGLGYLALGPGMLNRDRPAELPALVMPTTPTPGLIADEILLDLSIPAAAIPSGDGSSSGLLHATIPPGTQGSWQAPPGACCSGLRVDYVLEGSYTVRASGPVQVVRASGSGTPETVPADTEFVLEPGDAMIGPNETVFDAANTGSTPVQLLAWNFLAGAGPDAQVPSNWVQHDDDVSFGLSVPAGPATVRLRRITLAPEGELPSPRGVFQFAVTLPDNAAGTPVAASLGKQSNGAIFNINREPANIYVLTFTPTGPETAMSTPAPARE
jgi:mannose-6-phosphate isomerase-like protein (cupin superfamily)